MNEVYVFPLGEYGGIVEGAARIGHFVTKDKAITSFHKDMTTTFMEYGEGYCPKKMETFDIVEDDRGRFWIGNLEIEETHDYSFWTDTCHIFMKYNPTVNKTNPLSYVISYGTTGGLHLAFANLLLPRGTKIDYVV
jgi:hypothetical protein